MTDDRFADVDEDGGIAGHSPEFVDADGTQTRYYDLGEGDPLVLIHGGRWAGTSNANAWAPSFEPLSREFRVLAFDRIGCGMTDNPDDPEDYRYGAEVEHALAFFDAVGVEDPHLVGSSLGGALAACTAVEAPDRFETLVITNSHSFGPPAGDRAHRGERLFERGREPLEPTDPAYTRFRYEQFSHRTDHVTDEFCRTNAYIESRPKARETAEVLGQRHERFEASREEHIRGVHERIRDGVLTIPTLYVFGRNDVTVPVETGIAAFDLLGQENPDVRLELVNECGHLPYREHPTEFAATVTGFVRRWE